MRYEDDIIEEVREKNDIVEVVSQYVKLTRRGSSYMGLCPFHNEKTPSFSVSQTGQFFHCFGCGVGGNVFSFVMQYENATFPEALSMLAERAGVRLPEMQYSPEARDRSRKRNALLEINRLAGGYYYYLLRQEAGRKAFQYLTDRGLTPEIIQKFGLGYAGSSRNQLYSYLKQKGYSDELLLEAGLFYRDAEGGMGDKFFDRVMFPIMDAGSRVIGFGGRVMSPEGKPKYLNSPETMIFDKGRNLYGLQLARSSRQPNLILCEGYMDVIAMHQAGFSNAVASLGTALTSGHASLIKRYTDDVLLLYDSDQAGIKATVRAIRILRETGLRSRVVSLKPCKDPDEFIKKNGASSFRERLENAQDSFMFLVGLEAAGADPEDPQSINRFYNQTASLLLELDDELERNLYLDAVIREYAHFHVSERDLKQRIAALAMKGRKQPTLQPSFQEPEPKGKKKEHAGEQAQKLMLTWLVTWPSLFELTMKYLSPGDFTKPLYQEVARMLFEQYRQGEVNPARLLNAFPDPQDQNEVAALFNASIRLEENQIGQAYADTLILLKEQGIRKADEGTNPESASDLQETMRLLEETRALQDMKKNRNHLAQKCNEVLKTADTLRR